MNFAFCFVFISNVLCLFGYEKEIKRNFIILYINRIILAIPITISGFCADIRE